MRELGVGEQPYQCSSTGRLEGYSAPVKYTVSALVLVLAVTIDAVARRGRGTSR